MKYHVKTYHEKIYEDFLKTEALDKDNSPANAKRPCSEQNQNTNKKKKAKSSNNERIDQYFPKKILQVPIDREEFIDGVIEMVTAEGRPFSLVEDPGFRKIINPILRAFGITVNRRNIKDYIHEQYLKTKMKIEEMLKGKLLSVKVDCVTKLDRSFIGINIQFLTAEKTYVITVGTVEILERHTGANLKNLIAGELHKFGVLFDQVYTLTTDNGANVVKIVELINDDEFENQLNDMMNDLNEEDIDDPQKQEPHECHDHEHADIDNTDPRKENIIKCNACRELVLMAKLQGCDWETVKSKNELLQKNKCEKCIQHIDIYLHFYRYSMCGAYALACDIG